MDACKDEGLGKGSLFFWVAVRSSYFPCTFHLLEQRYCRPSVGCGELVIPPFDLPLPPSLPPSLQTNIPLGWHCHPTRPTWPQAARHCPPRRWRLRRPGPRRTLCAWLGSGVERWGFEGALVGEGRGVGGRWANKACGLVFMDRRRKGRENDEKGVAWCCWREINAAHTGSSQQNPTRRCCLLLLIITRMSQAEEAGSSAAHAFRTRLHHLSY